METRRISVVDDEPSILEVVERYLSQEGYEVSSYSDPTEAVAQLPNWKPDLVITDLKMAKLNGIDVIRAVKQFNPEINVIVMTAHASVDSAVAAIRNGAIDYVIKPFKFDDLHISIQRGLSQTRFIPLEKKMGAHFPEKYKVRNLIGSSQEMQKVYSLIQKSAKTSRYLCWQ